MKDRDLEKISERIKRAIEDIMSRYPPNINCFRFHLELLEFFPDAEPYYTGDHVITKIGDRFYDKDGLSLYPMKSEPRIYQGAFHWGDLNIKTLTLRDRVEYLEKRLKKLEGEETNV